MVEDSPGNITLSATDIDECDGQQPNLYIGELSELWKREHFEQPDPVHSL